MTNNDTTTSQPQLIAVGKLEKSPLNVRRTVRTDGIGELKASILSHGLMQNLVVTDSGDGTYLVIAGGRRLEAIQSLQAEGKLPHDLAVPCQIVTEAQAQEMSLAENMVRLAMHPADQFEAFAGLIEQGHTAAEVAERFGIEEGLVHKRMKLARVAPELLQEYRDDAITLECLMAYTVTDDHRKQRKVYKSLQGWRKDDPSEIRAVLTEKLIDANSKLALFVGMEAYMEAGGTSRADLFSEEVYLEKPTILNRLAEQKLDGIRRDLESEGWGWIEINPERDHTLINRCSRLQPRLTDAPAELLALKEQLDAQLHEIDSSIEESESEDLPEKQQAILDRLDEVDEKLARFVGFDGEHKSLAGCFVSIGQDGTPFIDKGLVKPEHRKQLEKLLGTPESESKCKPKGQFPETLRRDLANARLQVAQVEIARHPSIAFDLLVFQVASTTLDLPAAGDGAEVHFKQPRLYGASEAETVAVSALTAVAKSLPVEWLKGKSEASRFEAFRQLPDTAKLDLLAYCLALTLRPKLAPGKGEEVTAYDISLSLTGSNVADYWRPTRENFLGRATREQLLDLRGLVLGKAWSQSHGDDKKGTLVEQLSRAFSDPEHPGRTADQVERLKTWLPEGMAFGISEAAPAKRRKAAKAA